MRFSKIIAALIVIAALLLIGDSNPIFSQTKKAVIKSEIYIMEDILDQLLQASRQNLFEGKNIKGFYLDDFGLVFTVSLERNFFSVFSFGNEFGISVGRSGSKKDKEKDKARSFAYMASSMDTAQMNQWMDKLNKKIHTFLGTYVDVNNHIGSNENVGVLVSFNNMGRNQPLGKFYQVVKSNIVEYRNDRIDRDGFVTRIKQQNIDDGKELEQISIMSRILHSSLSEKRNQQIFGNRNINGVYINNLGVMFTVGGISLIHDFAIESIPFLNPGAGRAEDFVFSVRKRQEEEKKKVKERISDYKKKIVKIIGDYGPSLRFLPANQSIIVLFGADGGFSDVQSSNVLIRLKKRDVMRYSQNKLDLTGLIKLAQLEEY